MNEDYIVRCSNLTKVYGSKPALRSVDLELGKGRIIGLLGPNGSGKTTLIKLLNGLITPSAGKVLIDDEVPGVYTKNLISYLPDKTYFTDWMTVNGIIETFSDFYSNFNAKKCQAMCESLELPFDKRVKQLSKGTIEKLQLILVMSRDVPLYLLDEPIAGVDPAAREFILDTIIRNYDENSTILISTHLITDIERILDEAIFIKDGEIIKHDTVENIREAENKSLNEVFKRDFKLQSVKGW